MTGAQFEAASGERQADDQERAERATPLFPLTFRAMHGMRRHPARSSGRLRRLASVSACSAGIGLLSGARSGRRLESGTSTNPAVPSPSPVGTPISPSHPRRRARACVQRRRPGSERLDQHSGSFRIWLFEGNPSGHGSPSTGGGGTGQGSPGNGSGNGQGQGGKQSSGAPQGQAGEPVSSKDSSSSSPLVPILIAIAALAAISIGAVVIRQRRQRRPPARGSRRRRANRMLDSEEANRREGTRLGGGPGSGVGWAWPSSPRRRRRCRHLLGRRPAGDAQPRTVPAPAARWRRQRPHPDRLGRGPADPGRRLRLDRGRLAGRQRTATAGLRGPAVPHRGPGLGGARGVRSPVRTTASRRPATCRSAASRGPVGSTFVKAAVARYGPNGSFWVEQPGRAQAPDPHLADLERGELQVLRRQAQPGRIREAGASSPTRRSKAPTPARRSSSAACSPGPRGVDRKRSRSATTSPPTSSNRCTGRRPGSRRKFNGVALHPYSDHYQELTREIEEVRAVDERQPRRRQGPLDHRARLELRGRRPGSDLFAKGPAGQAAQLRGRLLAARAATR